MIVGCGDLTILLVGLGFHCFLLKCKEKLRHSLGRPSRSDFVQLEFEDTPENRAYFEKYSSDVFNDSSNIVGKPKSASYVENGITYNYTVTIRESFLMGKYGGAKVTTYWDGNRLLTIKISSGKQTRYRHY